jgi:hypothetical protein
VPAGPISVTVTLAGYKTATSAATVVAGQSVVLGIVLTP